MIEVVLAEYRKQISLLFSDISVTPQANAVTFFRGESIIGKNVLRRSHISHPFAIFKILGYASGLCCLERVFPALRLCSITA